jgi:hypothetical protein
MNYLRDLEPNPVRCFMRQYPIGRLRRATNVRWASAALIASAAGLMTDIARAEDLPEAISAPGETVLLEVHGEGAQIYECKADAKGNLVWMFREPIATLFRDGKTVGRHYVGPRWDLSDGGLISGKVEAKAPGESPSDIPWLKLTAWSPSDEGALAGVTTIQRIHTRGGSFEGSCETVGTFRSVPYSADYVFLKK